VAAVAEEEAHVAASTATGSSSAAVPGRARPRELLVLEERAARVDHVDPQLAQAVHSA